MNENRSVFRLFDPLLRVCASISLRSSEILREGEKQVYMTKPGSLPATGFWIFLNGGLYYRRGVQYGPMTAFFSSGWALILAMKFFTAVTVP